MPKKSISEMNLFERLHHSLGGKTFRAIVLFGLVLSIASVGFGFFLYASSVRRDFRNRAWQMARTAARVIDTEEALDEAGLVAYYFQTASEEQQMEFQDKKSPSLSRFDDVRTEAFEKIRHTLLDIQESSGGIGAFTCILDTQMNRRIFVADSDPTDGFCPPGSWDYYTKENMKDLTEGRQYFPDELFGVGKINATTIHMDPYGYRIMGCTILGMVEGYPVCVCFDIDMNEVKKTLTRFFWIYVGIVAIITLLAVVNAVLYMKKVTVDPINQLAEAARSYTEDRDDTERNARHFGSLDIHTGDEIEALSLTMKDMEADLGKYIHNLTRITAERERMSTELNLATRIQESMLPSIFPAFPERSDFDVYASMDPAKEVGGDFYDFFLVDDDHLALVIADVSGKGIPAALFMMASKIILANHAKMGKSPAEILTDTNALICSNNREEMFVTVWLGILELSSGKLLAANAGHEYPAMMEPGGQYKLIRDKHGLVIGGMDGIQYKDYELQLRPGTKLFLYTDGVPEASDAQKKLFGSERMLDALNKDPAADPEHTIRAVRAAVEDFAEGAEQFDDITMLSVEYKGKNAL
ncbi:MAG: serine/threonine-protein phosphatase [Lachnospiraceae bacterium]|nr:serine/threonine-protein phosphatase [Lachnospiraceae bacterium]